MSSARRSQRPAVLAFERPAMRCATSMGPVREVARYPCRPECVAAYRCLDASVDEGTTTEKTMLPQTEHLLASGRCQPHALASRVADAEYYNRPLQSPQWGIVKNPR